MNRIDVENLLDKIMQFEEVVNNPNHAGNEYHHLKGVFELVCAWGGSEDLQKAALCHNAYDLERPVSFKHRKEILNLIGEQAEKIVYFFCALSPAGMIEAINKSSLHIKDLYSNVDVHLSKDEFSDLVTLALANWLEQRPRLSIENQSNFKDTFLSAKSFLSDDAYLAFKRAYFLL